MKNLYLALLLALCLTVLVVRAQDDTVADADDVSGNASSFQRCDVSTLNAAMHGSSVQIVYM